MTNFKAHFSTWRALSIGSALVVAATLSACATAETERNADQDTCAGIGTSYGSSGHTACMLQQQQRRDNKMLLLLEEQRIHMELGRPAREMLEQKRARKDRESLRDK